jgi:hypothetical protein
MTCLVKTVVGNGPAGASNRKINSATGKIINVAIGNGVCKIWIICGVGVNSCCKVSRSIYVAIVECVSGVAAGYRYPLEMYSSRS